MRTGTGLPSSYKIAIIKNPAFILLILSALCLYGSFIDSSWGVYFSIACAVFPILTVVTGMVEVYRKFGSKSLSVIAISGGSLILLAIGYVAIVMVHQMRF